MNRDDVIRWAREAGIDALNGLRDDNTVSIYYEAWPEQLSRFAALVAAAEREAFPDLTAVINWLENGCDPKEAAKELRLYAAAIRAREQP